MTYILLTILTIFSPSIAQAAKGVVIVLNAPVFEKPNEKSRILHYVRKGEIIFIRDDETGVSLTQNDYNNPNTYISAGDKEIMGLIDDRAGKKQPRKLEGEQATAKFYTTLTPGSRPGFVHRKFIKMIYGDQREFSESITPFKHDPTDYRLDEPLSETYPLYVPQDYRLLVLGSFGTARKNFYNYRSARLTEDFGMEKSGFIAYTGGVEIDKSVRMSFGGFFTYTSSESTFTLSDSRTAIEQRGYLGAGPLISYDTFRNDQHRITLLAGASVNYHRRAVEQFSGTTNSKEKRLYTGWSLFPRAAVTYQRIEVLPHIDLVVGLQGVLQVKHYLYGPAGDPTLSGFWTEEDSLKVHTGGQFTFLIGLQSTTK